MLTDASLINTILLSGITNIRYTCYVNAYAKSSLVSFLTCDTLNSNPSYMDPPPEPHNDTVDAYRHMLALNIPATWHILSNQKTDKDMVTLELWVFWFDSKHTHIIETDARLKKLQETKSGSFNWNQITLKNGLSPTASPQLSSAITPDSSITLVPGTEYKLFIKSIRNLIQRVMVHKRHAFALGEFFVFPETYQDNGNVIKDEMTNCSSMSVKNTMLACMYNVYFTCSNLVFQPNTRRMRLRPLSAADVYCSSSHLKVLLCPTGEHARLLSFHSLPTDMQSKALDQWAAFYDMPGTLLTRNKALMPSLVTIRTASQDTVVYPSALVFVPTDTKQSPAAVAGMNGIMGLNHGLTEDLGSKASRMAYYEQLKLNNNNTQARDAAIDYWSYRDPIIHVTNAVSHALSTMDVRYQQDQMMLHRALIEPIVGSPLMNAKSVVPTAHYDSSLLMSGLHRKSITPPATLSAHNIQLTDYVASRFDDTPASDPMLDVLQDSSVAAVTSHDSLDIGGGSHLSALLNKALIIDSTTDHPPFGASDNNDSAHPPPLQLDQPVAQTHTHTLAIKDEPQALQPPLEDFSLMYDLGGANLHKTDTWDTEDGFGDLDLDVTDADFDFFETPAVAAPPPLPASEPNVLHIMPMDIDSPKTAPTQPEPLDQEMVDVQVSEINKPTTPNNNDSLFTPFIVSHDSTENTSMVAADTVVVDETSYTATPIVEPERSIPQKRVPYQKSTPEPSSFVPRDFLPVPVSASVNDAKYSAGGKFMYDPSKDHAKAENKGCGISKEAPFYSPDYIPTKPKKKLTKPKQQALNAPKADPSLEAQTGTVWRHENGSGSSSSSDSSSSSSGSSDESSSSGNDSFTTDDGSQDSDTESESDMNKIDDNPSMIEKRLKALKKFQRSVIYSQLKATPAPVPTDRLQCLDYDTPFAPILAHGSIKPIKWRRSKAMEESLDYLCAQAVLGGYPLAGGLAEVSENGGEIEGEPAKVLVARRTNLMQMTRGVVTHVPSLQADVFSMTHDFKSILQDTFIEAPADAQSDMDLVGTTTTPDALEPVSYPSSPLMGKIDIKGPLNIQEYYDLSESQHQGHSKYGKYQIKKKRPDEPNLDIIKRPDIVACRHEDSLEGSSSMIPFWEKLGLDPYSAKKQIKYLVVYPSNSDIENSVRHFFRGLGNVYEACHLGRHEPGYAGPFTNGLVPVSVADLDNNESSVRQRLKSYEETCEAVGRHLAMDREQQQQQQSYTQNDYTVIYIVNPGPHMSSYLDMCRCFYKLKEAYARVAHKHFTDQQPRISLQLVPIDHILRPSAFGGYTMLGMKDIAFSVYSKCFTRVTRKITKPNQASWTDVYAPAFVLTKPLQRTIKFKLNDIRPFPTIMEQNAVLHMAYCFSYDRAWMAVVWVDDRGELLEYDLFSRKTAFKEAWHRTLEIAKRTAFPWTIVIAKLGLMFNDELLYWLRYVSAPTEHHVTIVAMDIESGLNLHFNACYPNRDNVANTATSAQQQPSFLDAHGQTHAAMAGGGMNYAREQQSKHRRSNSSSSNTSTAVSEAQILLLNHRISYSQKRERAFKGILRPEAITEKENWMIPLATGYLIHHSLPNKNVNPCMEQFNNEAFVAEIHLLHNQTDVSAYSTLQDIIKRLYALSFINPIPSSHTCMPYHVVLAERLSRVLLVIDDSIR